MKHLICILLLPFMVASCQQNETVEHKEIRSVRYQIAKPAENEITRVFAGTTEAAVQSKLSFRIQGTVISIPVEAGDQVKKNQLIAKLDPYPYQLKVEEAKAILLEQQARERQATADYERIRQLYETKSSSKAELDSARASYESAKALVESKKKSLEGSISQLEYTELKAPQDGEISSREVKVNENVNIGQTIVEFHSRENIDITVLIPETYISNIFEGQKATVNFPSLGEKTYPAVVVEIAVTSKTISTFPIKVRLLEHDNKILAGMSAEVSILVQSESPLGGVWLLPRTILYENSKHYVYIINLKEKKIGVLEKREVTIGAIENNGILVTNGIKPDELVLTAGLRFATNGMVVKLSDEEEN